MPAQQPSPPKRSWLWIFVWFAWTAMVAGIARSSLILSLLIGAWIIGVVVAIGVGKLHPRAMPIFVSFSEFCASNALLTLLVLAGAGVGVFAGRDMAQDDGSFAAMTPAQHLVAARHEIQRPYNGEAKKHLDAIPANSPEGPEANALLHDIDPVVIQQEISEKEVAEKSKKEAQAKQEIKAQQEKTAAKQAAFEAMSPAEHLAAGKEALADGYDEDQRLGGRLQDAMNHLDAVPKKAKEAREAKRLTKVIVERLGRQSHNEQMRETRKAAIIMINIAAKREKLHFSVTASGEEHDVIQISPSFFHECLLVEPSFKELVEQIGGLSKFKFKGYRCL